jgi:hypothetical protein
MSKLGATVLYEVRVAQHTIERWKITETTMTLGANSERDAKREALRIAHARVNLPRLRSIRNQSWPYVKAREVEKSASYGQ